MRNIFFRGKRRDNGKWYYGSYLFLHVPDYDWTGMRRGPAEDVHFIVDEKDINYAVDAETLGQYTGLTDKNGKKVFDGDVLKWDEKEWGGPFLEVVKWDYEQFDMRRNDWPQFCEVIGNIFDNPELL